MESELCGVHGAQPWDVEVPAGEVWLNFTIHELKRLLLDCHGHQVENQTIYFRGRTLQDWETVASCGMEPDDFLLMGLESSSPSAASEETGLEKQEGDFTNGSSEDLLAGVCRQIRQHDSQINCLKQRLVELKEDNLALRECLEAKSMLSKCEFDIGLHKHRFDAISRRYPCRFEGGLEKVLDQSGLTFQIAAIAGLWTVPSFAAVSRAHVVAMNGIWQN
jgi:Ubiquitin family.